MRNTVYHLTLVFDENSILLCLLKCSIKNKDLYFLILHVSRRIFYSHNFQTILWFGTFTITSTLLLQETPLNSSMIHFQISSVWWANSCVLGAHIWRQLTTKSIYSKTFHTYNGQNVFPLRVLSACNMPRRGPDNGPFHWLPACCRSERCIMGKWPCTRPVQLVHAAAPTQSVLKEGPACLERQTDVESHGS